MKTIKELEDEIAHAKKEMEIAEKSLKVDTFEFFFRAYQSLNNELEELKLAMRKSDIQQLLTCDSCNVPMEKLSSEFMKCPNCGSKREIPQICPKCGGKMYWSRHCGAKVCNDCDNHLGLGKCFCGWNLRAGEVLEDDIGTGKWDEETGWEVEY